LQIKLRRRRRVATGEKTMLQEEKKQKEIGDIERARKNRAGK